MVTNSNGATVGAGAKETGDKMDVDAPAASAGASAGEKTYSIGTSSLCYRKDNMEIENPIEDGIGTVACTCN